MALCVAMQEARSQHSFLWKAVALTALGLSWSAPAALAKQASLTAIELYDGPSGAAYLQLSDVLINGKFEMRNCTPFQAAAIDHSTYGKMEKLALAPGGVLERGEDGVLRYSAGQGQAVCVAPENVKFDHNASYTASELADRVVLNRNSDCARHRCGRQFAALEAGRTNIFIAAPDPELAEYLRAQRAGDVAGWSDFLSKYPDSPHAGDAKLALASLYAGAGEASLDVTGSP